MTVPNGADAVQRTLWTTRLARYRRLAAQAEAAAATGWFRAAMNRYDREHAAIAARYGSWHAAGETKEGKSARRAAFRRASRAENAYWHRCTAPMNEAAETLVLTPAPDLQALRDKLAVIRTHRLQEEDSMTRDCIEVLDEDVGRINGYQPSRRKDGPGTREKS